MKSYSMDAQKDIYLHIRQIHIGWKSHISLINTVLNKRYGLQFRVSLLVEIYSTKKNLLARGPGYRPIPYLSAAVLLLTLCFQPLCLCHMCVNSCLPRNLRYMVPMSTLNLKFLETFNDNHVTSAG